MNYFDSTNDSSHHALNVVVTREKQNSILVEATAEKKYENTLRPHGIQNKLAKSDKVVQDYPPEAKKSKKSKSTDPEEQKGQNIPFKEPYEDDHENMVLEGDKVCIAGSDVASENKNMVLEGDKLCIAGADVANDNENMVLEGGKVYIAGGDVASIALDSETVPVDSCKVLQASEYISAQPVIDPIWRGSFNTGTVGYELYDGLVAHLSSKAGPKVWEETKLLSESLCLDLVPKESVWPRSFQKSAPSDENIALYFFALDKRCIKDFDGLVSEMRSRELALRAVVTNAQLLVFTSDELPRPYWNLKGKFYLWGIFVKKKQVDSSVRNGEENITNNTALDSMSPVCSLSNIISSRMRWTLPESGELKLNVNASFNPETRESAVGGLIRDKDGKWVHGFYMYLRNFNPETAQFCALSRGLEIARKLKIPKLVLESNSEKAIEAVTSACPNHPSYRYIKHIRGSMDKDLICRIKMINRVANMCAIRLALEAFGSLTTNELPEPPEFMLNYLASDLQMGHDDPAGNQENQSKMKDSSEQEINEKKIITYVRRRKNQGANLNASVNLPSLNDINVFLAMTNYNIKKCCGELKKGRGELKRGRKMGFLGLHIKSIESKKKGLNPQIGVVNSDLQIKSSKGGESATWPRREVINGSDERDPTINGKRNDTRSTSGDVKHVTPNNTHSGPHHLVDASFHYSFSTSVPSISTI